MGLTTESSLLGGAVRTKDGLDMPTLLVALAPPSKAGGEGGESVEI